MVYSYEGTNFQKIAELKDFKFVAFEQTVENVKAANGNGYVKLSWEPNINFYNYEVYRVENKGEVLLGKTTDTSFVDKTVKPGVKYQYFIRTETESYVHCYEDYYQTATETDSELINIKHLDSPALKSAFSVGSKSIKVKWDKLTGASGYYIYTSLDNKTWSRVTVKSGKTTECTVNNLKTNGKYYVKIRAFSDGCVSPFSATKTLVVGAPLITAAKYSNGKISLNWTKQSNASFYRIYIKNQGDSAYTKKIDVKNINTLSYTFKVLSTKAEGTDIKVRAFYKVNGKYVYSTSSLKTVSH